MFTALLEENQVFLNSVTYTERPVTLCNKYFNILFLRPFSSEMSYERGSDSRRLRIYGYLKCGMCEQACTCSQAKVRISSTSASKKCSRYLFKIALLLGSHLCL